MNYYNEFDAYPAQWLRNLIALGFLPPGDVDTRSIKDVKPDDLKGYTQCHFFAGIGGWSNALAIAGWPTNRRVWTGSCPCQPFSVAGKQAAQADERHLWPIWFELIRECRPSTIFGEQVSGAIAHGWLDDVYKGLEAEDYAVGAAVLPACSVGAPHKRDRLWFVANTARDGWQQRRTESIAEWETGRPIGTCKSMADAESRKTQSPESRGLYAEFSGESFTSRRIMADSTSGSAQRSGARGNVGGLEETFLRTREYTHNWNVEPGVGRVANGIPARVGRLRAYGNAIVPQVAAEFITAFMECAP